MSKPELHVETCGQGPRLVLAHGFTQSSRVWGGLDDYLSVHHRLALIDLPGHGGSSGIRADLLVGAALLGEAGGPASYLGYSMGARFCLHLALVRPELVHRLVLVSGTAGIDGAAERSERRQADEALAERLAPTRGGQPEDTVAEFVDRWVTSPMFGDVPAAANGLDERKRNTAAGLASSLRLAGSGTQAPLWDRLGELAMPVLVVTGARDTKFTAVGQRMVESIGSNASHVEIGDADHAPQLQRPQRVASVVHAFLCASDPD